MLEENQPIHIENSIQTVTGNVKGDLTQTVNFYLSANETLKALWKKIKNIDAKLQKKGIDEAFALYLQKDRYELKERYDKQSKAIEQAYYQVLKYNFTDEELKELQQLFLEGKHDSIAQRVQPKVIAENIELRAKASYKDAMKMLVLAQSTAIQFEDKDRFEKAVEYYELSLKADRNTKNLFAYAFFLQKHNQNNKVAPLYQEALGIYQELTKENLKTFRPDVALTLNNLGLLQRDKNEFEKAKKNYQEALAIRRKLAKENPKTFRPDVAMTLNNLALLHRAKNEFEKAEKNYQKALGIYRELAKENPKTFRPDVAMTLNNLALLQSTKNEFEKAEKNYQEASGIYRELAKENPKTFRPDVAMILNNLGLLQSDKNELEKAEKNYQEALEIYQELAKENPKTFRPDVAMILNNLALLQWDKNEFERAEKNYQEALTIRRKLAKENPKTFRPNVAMTLNNLALLQWDKNELEKAEKNYQEALAIRRKLAKENPKTFSPDVAITLINMSIFYQESKVNKELSIQLVDEAITHLWFFQKTPYIQNYLKEAFEVLEKWDIDVDAYMKKKHKEMENR